MLPDHFIPLAEARRLMLPIGHWVLRQALRQARQWREKGLPAVPVAINLSTLQFQSVGFVEDVERALAEQGAEGSLLELELTERMLMDDLSGLRQTLGRLKAMGVRIAIDDFGTGYTSLSHLKELPIDRLKIDRSFIKDLPNDRGSAAIARAIIQMARSLGLRTVAEASRRRRSATGCAPRAATRSRATWRRDRCPPTTAKPGCASAARPACSPALQKSE